MLLWLWYFIVGDLFEEEECDHVDELVYQTVLGSPYEMMDEVGRQSFHQKDLDVDDHLQYFNRTAYVLTRCTKCGRTDSTMRSTV